MQTSQVCMSSLKPASFRKLFNLKLYILVRIADGYEFSHTQQQ